LKERVLCFIEALTLIIAQVHLDIKPGNFCVNNDLWDPSEDKVYIIDFGGAQRAPTVEKSDVEYIYFGTADYSGSMAMMQYMMPGPSDDTESLCYRSEHSCTPAFHKHHHQVCFRWCMHDCFPAT
jgi:predicted unusual protein kinase regulating ubiquinone biosynthesis (AarF/ABC1/UbiB family)